MLPPTTLTPRQLNRATLARQMLLARVKTTPLRAIESLVGLQAQLARPPFIGLWSRVEGFRRENLIGLLLRRKVVRATLMRATLHLMSAKDYVNLRAAIQPALRDALRSVLRDRASRLDLDRLVAAARAFFADKPRTFDELRAYFLKLDPKADERAMGYAVRTHLPLVQVPTGAPTETTWGYPGSADFALAESWLGKPLGSDEKPHTLVRRYLAAFGPATANDAQTWSGLTGLRDVLEEIRPKLIAFRDQRGRELFDLPNAPRPPENTTAPARFIPEYDNLILSHADRTRLVADEHRPAIVTSNLRVLPTFLVDGFVSGTWKIERKKAAAVLVIEPFEALSRKAIEDLTAEANRLVRFVEEDARSFEVRFAKR